MGLGLGGRVWKNHRIIEATCVEFSVEKQFQQAGERRGARA